MFHQFRAGKELKKGNNTLFLNSRQNVTISNAPVINETRETVSSCTFFYCTIVTVRENGIFVTHLNAFTRDLPNQWKKKQKTAGVQYVA